MIIGLDLDNTIVSYDAIFYRAGLEKGLIPDDLPVSKAAVRDHIWRTAGDEPWQCLQAEAYGPRMAEAAMMPGADAFLRAAGAAGVKLYVVSHKTAYARRDATRTNLRAAALDWLAAQGFFADQDIPLAPADVYFESTRQEKIRRVLSLGCQIMVDDLPELLADPALSGLERICIAATGSERRAGMTVLSSWKEITAHVFG